MLIACAAMSTIYKVPLVAVLCPLFSSIHSPRQPMIPSVDSLLCTPHK